MMSQYKGEGRVEELIKKTKPNRAVRRGRGSWVVVVGSRGSYGRISMVELIAPGHTPLEMNELAIST